MREFELQFSEEVELDGIEDADDFVFDDQPAYDEEDYEDGIDLRLEYDD